MKKIPFRQTTQFGCGLYTLSNLFNREEFIADIPKDDGNFIAEINNALAVMEPDLFIDPLFLTNATFKVGNRFDKANVFLFFDILEDKEAIKAGVMPFFISFARPNGALHYIALLTDIATGKWYVVDSCEEEVFEVELLWFLKNYHVISVSYFCSRCEGRVVMGIFSPEECAHLI